MARRLHKTLIDYLVIAISPALIMTLVGSLVFFLLEVFYQGNFQGRLQYIFALFVIGAVLIGRISIEEGRERAALFALPLGIATLLAINKFVQFQGGVADSLSFLINCGLIGVVWWSADKLTWDCTLIDESEEDTGEGLLETVGLDRPDRAALRREIEPVPAEPEATTSRDESPRGWWERFVERRRRPHAPGVWVVYFSLAALPLFGVGQLFIPANDLAARQYAFRLLFVYTAGGLGLLLSTSFLGLRRYLRQRRQEMPLVMVNLWLTIGAVLIIGVMLAAMLLPRPNAEYAVSELPFRVGAPDQESSRYGKGSDGVEEEQLWASKQPHEGESSGSVSSDRSGNESSDKSEAGSHDGQSAAKGQEGESRTRSDDSGQPDDDKPEDEALASDESESSTDASDDADKSEPSSDSDAKSMDRSNTAEKPSPQNTQERPSDDRRALDSTRPLRAFPPLKPPFDVSALLLSLAKWLLYGMLALLAIFWIWKNLDTILTALGNLGQWLQDFWQRFFGGTDRPSETAADEAAPHRAPQRRFADFVDPFVTGTAARYAPEELVRYTFEALEAWARDRGHPRQSEQTPHEFSRSVGSHVSSLADDALGLADLYAQVAYAPGTVPAASVARLSRLWQNLRKEAATADSVPIA